MNIFSKNPKLSLEKFLVMGAVGLYVLKHIQLKRSGELAGEPDLLLKIDKEKMFEAAKKKFKLSDLQAATLEGVYDSMTSKKEEL